MAINHDNRINVGSIPRERGQTTGRRRCGGRGVCRGAAGQANTGRTYRLSDYHRTMGALRGCKHMIAVASHLG